MNQNNNNKNTPIVVVSDSSLGRERQASLTKTWAHLRNLGTVTVLSGTTTEDQLIRHLDSQPTALVLLPWSKYLIWSRLEGHLGLTRKSGPTSAGYFGAPLDRHELGPANNFQRVILLDFASTQQVERWRLVRALVREEHRSGIRPLVHPKSVLYHESWLGSHAPGDTLHPLLAMEQLRREPWKARQCGIQSIVLSLWNLAFEQGRAIARGGWLSQIHADRVRAYFEMSLDNDLLAFRLCYQQNPNTAKAAVRDYWPRSDSTDEFRQMLLQFADFVRVHPIADRNEIEIVAGLLKSAPAKQRPNELRTTWVEPLAMELVSEIPSERNPEWAALEKPLSESGTTVTIDTVLRLEQEIQERDARLQELINGGLANSDETELKKVA